MIGAAINVIPFSIQRSVPGIGPYVLHAFVIAAVPAVLAALAYAVLASAMPRAGGSYVYASRALSPYLGFVASFSQWFGLSIAIGVVAYVLVPFLRDIAGAAGWGGAAGALERRPVRLTVALVFLWTFVAVNLRGLKSYERTLVPLMFLMFALGGVVVAAGFAFDHGDFAAAVLDRDGREILPQDAPPFSLATFLPASVLLFSSFIGFDSIAQAGGEARDPHRTLPLAIGVAVVVVGAFYLWFTAAVYHAVPWSYVAEQAAQRDVTAPGLLGYVLAPAWTVAIVAGAAVALTNDLPAMLLAVSRLMFAWAEDGIFPRAVARVHPTRRTPHVALMASGVMASLGVMGSHLAGDFFLGVDILVISMLVTFLLMALSVLALPARNPGIARDIRVLAAPGARVAVAGAGVVALGAFLAIHAWNDLSTAQPAWYYHSTYVWLVVMALASAVYRRELGKLRQRGVDVEAVFARLPPE
jgi:amino acid transporter